MVYLCEYSSQIVSFSQADLLCICVLLNKMEIFLTWNHLGVEDWCVSSGLGLDVLGGFLPGGGKVRLREDVKVAENGSLALGLAGVAPHVGLIALVETSVLLDLPVVGGGGTVTTDGVVGVHVLQRGKER